MKVTIQKTMNVQDPVRAHDTDAGPDLYVPEGQTCPVRRGDGSFGSTGTGATVRDYATQGASILTVGRLMGQLQDAAFRYGNDTPIAVLAGGGVGYEQADGLAVIKTVKTSRAGGWDQYRADTDGTPMAVIS